jgi:allantoinase
MIILFLANSNAMFDLAIRSRNIISAKGIEEGVVIVEDGMITEVRDKVYGNDRSKVIDVGDKILMAGVIDPHVHVNEPGRTDWEGFDTATKAAIAGGVTTIVDMPLNSSPVTTTVNAFEEKLAAAQYKIHTNVGFWGGIIPGNADEIERLVAEGVLGFKAFLTHSGIDEFPNVSEEDLRKALPIIAKHGLPLLVHCELNSNSVIKPTYSDHTKTRLNDLSSKLNANTSYQNYLVSRPKEWEDDAIALMIRLSEEFNCRIHIVHLSSSNSIKQLAEAKQRVLPITVETGQHYLYFNAEEIKDGQTQFKCAPPIRQKANNDKLWDALKTGVIDFVATDHSPAPPEMKQTKTGDFMKAWGGIASLQFALPALWTAAKKRNFTVPDIAGWLCEKPAELIGRQNSKGRIQAGFDADLIVWDANKKFTVTKEIIQHRHKITPYLNNEFFGVVEQTYLAGQKVYENGQFVKLKAGKIITESR